MSKKLVAYFSCTGITESVAEKLSDVVNGELYEILPKIPYTDKDLNWRDKNSRSSIEMSDNNSRPEIANKINNMEEFDTIFLGFPIWWYIAPKIINTFLESYDFSNKTIVIFYTSGGSGLGDTIEELSSSCSSNKKIVEGKRFTKDVSLDELKTWIDDLEIL